MNSPVVAFDPLGREVVIAIVLNTINDERKNCGWFDFPVQFGIANLNSLTGSKKGVILQTMWIVTIVRRCSDSTVVTAESEMITLTELWDVSEAGYVTSLEGIDTWYWHRETPCNDNDPTTSDNTYGLSSENYYRGIAYYYRGYEPVAGDSVLGGDPETGPFWNTGVDEGEPWGDNQLGVFGIFSGPPDKRVGHGVKREYRYSWNCCCGCRQTQRHYAQVSWLGSQTSW